MILQSTSKLVIKVSYTLKLKIVINMKNGKNNNNYLSQNKKYNKFNKYV